MANRFGIREICDVVFKPLVSTDIGNRHFDAGEPVLYIDSAKTSSLEGAATTVYAQGGQGNPRLIGWDGEKTLTFTLEDALMSPTSFALLSGAGIVHGKDGENGQKIYVHANYDMVVEEVDLGEAGTGGLGKTAAKALVGRLTYADRNGATLVVSKEAPVYPVKLDAAGGQAEYLSPVAAKQVFTCNEGVYAQAQIAANGEITAESQDIIFVLAPDENGDATLDADVAVGDTIRVDCYEVHTDGATELQIDAENFAGYYYIEASTLFRDEATGADLPAEFVIPRGKIQSNFTFTMANSGDPSTFTFTIDCFPAYTKFNKKKKVMATLQIIDAANKGHNYKDKTVVGHDGRTGDVDLDTWYPNSIFDSEVKKQLP